jgi:xylulose-5-phosphate/fructose-6-phosphate phosphoketolase
MAQAELTKTELELVDAWWRAANYLSVGQIYLLDNPLLREPLRAEHVKPRLLGHFGTTPGLTLLWAHLNRAIRARDLNAIYVTGPGHGGPGIVAAAYLEGTYSELYPHVGEDEDGLRELFRQFSFPGGIPSHAAPETPGSIHEGGELGYALMHAFGAAFDNPDLLVACVVGDGEAETGPLATSWHSNKFLNPRTDGAVLPILHLNGWKIANPTVLARIPEAELVSFLEGCGWRPLLVTGSDPEAVHRDLAAALDEALDEIAALQAEARADGASPTRPRWPMLVLRTPKGWTGPENVDGRPVEGTWRAHQVPVAEAREDAAHRAILEEWLRSYRPEELFDESGRLLPELAELSPSRDRRMSANPHANGGELLRDLVRRTSETMPSRSISPARAWARPRGCSARSCATSSPRTRGTSASSGPTRRPRTASATSSPRPAGRGWRTSCPSTRVSRRTAGSWRCSRSTCARAGSRATSSRAGTDSSTATRPSSTSWTRC